MQQNDHTQYQSGHANHMMSQQMSNHVQTGLMNASHLLENKSNLYEHIDYNGIKNSHQPVCNVIQIDGIQRQQGDLISSSTSSGSVKSPNDHGQAKYRRGSMIANSENEAHDLRVFSTAHGSRPSDLSERQRLTDGTECDARGAQQGGIDDERDDEDASQVDETTAFRRQSAPDEEQRTRQLSKRKRKQQRNRMHNNNQKIG